MAPAGGGVKALGIWVDQLRLHWSRAGRCGTAQWPADTRLLAMDNAVVRIRDTGGAGPVIILTPDAPFVLEHYDRLISLLAPRARVICLELPGCGLSYPRVGFSFSMADYVRVLRTAMDRCEVERATLAFTCTNALVAMAFARAYPKRVEQLALAQVASLTEMLAFARRIDIRIAGLPILRTPVLGQVFMMARRRAVAKSWFRAALPKGFDRKRVERTTNEVFDQGGQFCLASLIQALPSVTAESVTPTHCPATVVWGTADRTHLVTRKEAIRDHLPDAVLEYLPACGHAPDIEAPELYSELLLNALFQEKRRPVHP